MKKIVAVLTASTLALTIAGAFDPTVPGFARAVAQQAPSVDDVVKALSNRKVRGIGQAKLDAVRDHRAVQSLVRLAEN